MRRCQEFLEESPKKDLANLHCYDWGETEATTSSPNLDSGQGVRQNKGKLNYLFEDVTWKEFWSEFRRVDVSDLCPIQKLIFLKSCLRGDAFSTIVHLTAVSGNYAYAKKILFEKYRIRQEIVDQHMGTLHNLEPCSSGCVKEIQRVYGIFKRHLESVELQGVQLDGQMLLYVFKTKLDADTLHDFGELCIGPSHLQTLSGLTHFLSERISLLKDVSEDRIIITEKVRKTVASKKKIERQNAENVILDRIRVRQEKELTVWTRNLKNVRTGSLICGNKSFPDVIQRNLPVLEGEIRRTKDEMSDISETGSIDDELESDSEAGKVKKIDIKRSKLMPQFLQLLR
jgi:hypothetical protein